MTFLMEFECPLIFSVEDTEEKKTAQEEIKEREEMELLIKQYEKEFQINEGRNTGTLDGSMYEVALKEKYQSVILKKEEEKNRESN